MSNEQIKHALYNSDQMKIFTEEKAARANEYMKMFIIISKQRKEN